jgi:ribosomal protein L11 methyltransferase
MPWKEVVFDVPPEGQELALALLYDLPFTMFEERIDGLAGYMDVRDWTPDTEAELRSIPYANWKTFTLRDLADENWNLQWESNFEPVILRPFCAIRATFHPPVDGVAHELIIQPEMAFGTGHHATTKLMLLGMQTLNLADRRVLDFGAGTAILGMMAARLGADRVDAVEIEIPACESARQNVARNGLDAIVRIVQGDSHAIPGPAYDMVLANINRNVLMDEMATLDKFMQPGALAGLSGFLQADGELIQQTCENLGWKLCSQQTEADWLVQWWQKA